MNRNEQSRPQIGSERPTGNDSETRAANLFLHMTRIFGHSWTAKYGDQDDGVWAAAVADLSADQIKRGLRLTLTDWRDSFPPTPGQFRELAMRVEPAAHRIIPPTRRIGKMAASDETVQEGLAAMRDLVK